MIHPKIFSTSLPLSPLPSPPIVLFCLFSLSGPCNSILHDTLSEVQFAASKSIAWDIMLKVFQWTCTSVSHRWILDVCYWTTIKQSRSRRGWSGTLPASMGGGLVASPFWPSVVDSLLPLMHPPLSLNIVVWGVWEDVCAGVYKGNKRAFVVSVFSSPAGWVSLKEVWERETHCEAQGW